jgi:transcriptional regulator with XRE-family HTH domain
LQYNKVVGNLEKIAAKRIKQAREAEGLTQAELADSLGVTRALITSLENGRSTLILKHLEVLPKILHRPISYFLGLDTNLTADEEELLALYRSLPTTGPLRRFVMAQVRSFVLVAQGGGAEEGDDELTE